MGIEKHQCLAMLDTDMRPGAVAGSYVCDRCFDDRGIREFVRTNASSRRCDFCLRTARSEIAAELPHVVRYIHGCLSREYEDPNNAVAWDGAWQGAEVWSTGELVFEEVGLELPKDDHGRLRKALSHGLGDGNREWCRVGPYTARQREVYRWSWENFCRFVKHERRYFFLTPQREDNYLLAPARLLRRIADLCERHGLFRIVKAGTVLHRTRRRPKGEALWGALDLGPPPAEKAILPNRMSPAGVPMFYASDDPETALLEIFQEPGVYATATFKLRRDARVLDLSDVPRIPTIFEEPSDEADGGDRDGLIFLHSFAEAVSQPIDRKDRAHIDYVPTQVVTEYFRSMRRPREATAVDGICYTSAKNPPRKSYVLYATQLDVVLDEASLERWEPAEREAARGSHANAWLEMVRVAMSRRTRPPPMGQHRWQAPRR
jgi:hypothetical protein